ncbi:hypothetical protein ACFQJ6_23520 [Halorussus caseinilyticus]|uniref:Hint domain-containing protein n=1 Tax=Halorussus caseinilyticus TaxID=3034025 RepID=A0ABD5WTV5_9EURY
MEVQLANGTTQPIGELATSDESVSVHTLNDGELVTRSASAFKTKEDVDVVRITTESGLSIRVTPDHEIRAENGEWVEASHLSPVTKSSVSPNLSQHHTEPNTR